MSTVAQVIERLYREILSPADDSPIQTPLTGAVDAVTATWPYTATVLSPDEEELFAAGVIVECEQEQALITAVDHTANTLTVQRGVNGTTAAAHAAGAMLLPAPTFARKAAFDAVADNVVALYPALYRRTTTSLTLTSGYTEVPAAVMTAVSAWYVSGGRPVPVAASLITDFTASSTGKAITVSGANTGSTVYFTYHGRFDRPTAEADDLATLGVNPEWERIVIVGAAAQLLSLREFDSVNTEFVTEQMRAEGYPAGTSSRLRNELLRYYQFLQDQARRVQLASYPEVVGVNAVVG